MDKKLSDIYYKPENLWKGNIAIKKLANESGINKQYVKKWLNKQAFWQVHRPPPRTIKDLTTKLQNQIRCINLICYTCRMILFTVTNTNTYYRELMLLQGIKLRDR